MKQLSVLAAMVFAILFSAVAASAQVPPVPTVPEGLPSAVSEQLQQQCDELSSELSMLQSKAGMFNSTCADVASGSTQARQCAAEQSQLLSQRQAYIDAVKELKARIRRLVAATNCRRRAQLASEWDSRRNRISVDQHIMGNLYATFKQQAASLEVTGADLAEMQRALDQIDRELDQLSSHRLAVSAAGEVLDDASETELAEYKVIAKGIIVWTGNIIKIVAPIKINKQTEAVIAELKDMQSRESQLVSDVAALEQVKRELAKVGPCDSTSLVE
jgi:chorismate mutase